MGKARAVARTVIKRDARQLPATETPVTADRGELSPDIDPALSLAEWNLWRCQRINPVTLRREVSGSPPIANNLFKLIALHNDQLDDEDPRKMTRATVALLQKAATYVSMAMPEVGPDTDLDEHEQRRFDECSETYSLLYEFADVIAALLPPESL